MSRDECGELRQWMRRKRGLVIYGGGAELQELVAWPPQQVVHGMGETTLGVEAGYLEVDVDGVVVEKEDET